MQTWHRSTKRNQWSIGLAFLIFFALTSWRLAMPVSGLDVRAGQAWFEIFFLLALYAYLNLTALGVGCFLLQHSGLPLLTKFEFVLLAYLLGLGGLAIVIMILGLLGWLRESSIYCSLTGSGMLAWIGLGRMEWLGWKREFPRAKNLFLILLQIIALIGTLLLFLECLLPVWDYDALLYHLEVPRQFLAQGKFYFDPEVLRSAYPYMGEMLFLVGMVFDLDSLAKMINLTFAVLFVLSTYAFSCRFMGGETPYTAVGILIGAPAFWMWSTWASIDFAWASYELWSVYAVSLWLMDDKRNSQKWLVLAGVMSGLGVGTKYLSIPSLLIVGALIAWKSIQGAQSPAKVAFSHLFNFGSVAAFVAGGWYIKNWIWTGNPVYPLIFGGPGWDAVKNQVLSDYVYSFGVGKSWLDFLLLPHNVYAFQDHFSTIGLERIHPVLWLAFLFPFVWKSSYRHDLIVVYLILGVFAWAINSQVIRFLIPLTAFMSILAGVVIERLSSAWKNLFRIGVVGGFMLFNLLFQLIWFQDRGSWDYLRGAISAEEYLQNMNYDFGAIQYIQKSLEPDAKVQFLWDGRNYYCDARCIPDDEQSTAVRLAIDSPAPEALASDLHRKGITHLLLSKPDASWFITYHDPHAMHRQSLKYFTEIFFPACGHPVYRDQEMYLYEVTCQ